MDHAGSNALRAFGRCGRSYGVDCGCGVVLTSLTRRRSVSASDGTNTCRRMPERGASHVLDTWNRRTPTVALRNVRIPESSTCATAWRPHSWADSGEAAWSRETRVLHRGSPRWSAMATRRFATILAAVASQSAFPRRKAESVKVSHTQLRWSVGI